MPVKVLCHIGDGIEIRTLHRGLAARIYQMVQADREHLARFLPWVQHTQSMADTVRFLAHAREAFLRGEAIHGAIWQENELVGMMALEVRSPADQMAHIGYWIGSRAEGKGVVTRALNAFVDYSFTEWDLHRLEIHCATGNERSCRVAERAGFQKEGVLRGARKVNGDFLDMNLYALLKPDWQAMREAARLQRD
ncbi:MAG: GNAT family N-acetyltransferase [Bryobacterales bacterium]|nr:GNAT family N-acetyltransferase [Bryobacterales bacterium]